MATPFITLQDVSDALGRDVTSDPGGTAALSSACAICRQEAGVSFNAGTATIRLNGTGGDALVLPEFPATVGTVSVDGSVITDYTTTDDGLLLRGTYGGMPRPVWPEGRQNVEVYYTYGYDDLEVPETVCRVAADLAIRIMLQGPLASETVGDVSVTYAQRNATDLSAQERRILKDWSRSRSF